ncbi:MAG: MmgE/PrpD family protein [Synergistaceae bacterium]|jgi:2-methylcitrate dehydratase PrpD|nr:MmgE/PrpD family protein [Synergistaceae bacterium]
MSNAAKNPLETLAEYISSFEVKDLPSEVRHGACACCIDAMGAAIGGLDYEEVPEVIKLFLNHSGRYGDGDPKSSIWGFGRETSVFNASLLNGILAHSLELDDVHTGSKTHIGAVVVPAAWAVGEAVGASGSEMLEAVVAGYETMARIGKGFGVSDHRLKGWHVSGTAGTFGAAAAASRLLKLDALRTLYALGMAGTQSFGLWAFLGDGATSKKLHTGRAAENGAAAAYLAKAGMTGPKHILDAEDGGLYRATSDSWDLSAVSRDLGSVYEILNVDRKPYPCCRSMHPALDAILQIRAEKFAPPEEIQSISIRSYEVGVKQCGAIKYPSNVSESKFSMRFGVAAAYLDGAATPRSFSMDKINDENIRDLASKIDYEASEEFTSNYPKSWGCGLSVTYRDGTVISRKVLDASGSIANPMTDAQIGKKFTELTSPFLGDDGSARALESLKDLEGLKSVRGLLSPRP